MRNLIGGLIDTDGEIFEKSANAQICLKNLENLMCKISNFLSSRNVVHSFKSYKESHYIFIPTASFKKFVSLVRSKHPYKQKIIAHHLKKGCVKRSFKGLKVISVNDFFIRNKDGLRVHGAGHIVSKFIGKLNKKLLAEKLNVKERTLYSWIKGKNSVPLQALFQLARMMGNNEYDILWSYGQVVVKIPFNLTKVKEVATYVRPGHTYINVINTGNKNREEIVKKIATLFGVKPRFEKVKNTYRFSSEILRDYFNFVFKYKPEW